MSTPFIKALKLPEGTPTPGDLQGFVNLMSQYLKVQAGDTTTEVHVGVKPPSVDGQDAIWLELDGTLAPVALRTWDGAAWRQIQFRIPMGSTTDRPPDPIDGDKFFDTTISQELIYRAGMWRTAWGGQGQRIWVHSSSEQDAVSRYPGWVIDKDFYGRFPVGASSDYLSGSLGGLPGCKTTLTEEQIPAHKHRDLRGELWSADAHPGNDQTGGCIHTSDMPNGDPIANFGVKTFPNSETGLTGDGAEIDVTPAYKALYVLKRL